MADDSDNTSSWWTTLPGILTAIATVITAVSSLLAALSQSGVFGERNKAFVSQKIDDIRGVASTTSGPAPIAATPTLGTYDQAAPIGGAVVTLRDGTVVRLRADITESCQGGPTLKTTAGQRIEMPRIRRLDLSDWSADQQRGSAHIVLDDGGALDVEIAGCALVGTSDQGPYRGPFQDIRSVEFVR